jgi:integrase
MKLTKLEVERLPIPSSEGQGKTIQKRYYDSTLKGFGLRITSGGTKAFFIEKLVNRKLRRITLGRYPELTVEMARKEAHKVLGKIATGIDPVAEKKEANAKSVTLKQAFAAYLNARKSLKPNTLFDYQRIMKEAFHDWQGKSLLEITKDMVAKRHRKLGEKSEARANLAMRFLRAIFNFAAGEYENAKGQSLIIENPVKRLSHTRAWYRVERRQTVIKAHELAAWYQAVISLQDERSTGKSAALRDYFLLILFTGLRREEAASLKWGQIDLKAKTLKIDDTKNHQAHVLPLSNFLYDLLHSRSAGADSDFVFPSSSKTGYIIEPRKVMEKVITNSGVTFTLHDLRRTFITIAESLDIPAYALKRLMNHKMNHDVTAGYIVMDVERLRAPMQMIADHLLKLMGVKKSADVIPINQADERVCYE